MLYQGIDCPFNYRFWMSLHWHSKICLQLNHGIEYYRILPWSIINLPMFWSVGNKIIFITDCQNVQMYYYSVKLKTASKRLSKGSISLIFMNSIWIYGLYNKTFKFKMCFPFIVLGSAKLSALFLYL